MPRRVRQIPAAC